jgi:hypothetical protein
VFAADNKTSGSAVVVLPLGSSIEGSGGDEAEGGFDIVVTHIAFLPASKPQTCEVWYNEGNRMQVTLLAGYGVFSVHSRNTPVYCFLPQTITQQYDEIQPG